MQVDRERLREDIERTAEFGRIESEQGRGRTVRAASEENGEAREYFVGRLEDAGLDVRVDAVGNVVGRWVPASADPDLPPVAAGSHLDSVPEGGIFDGPLGTYAALEAVRTMREADTRPERPITVVSFTEEEGGRFGSGMLGSSVAAGGRSVEEALALEDEEGTSLAEALDGIGFRGEGRVNAAGWDAWLELHIEQSERLETVGVPVGVVTDITGITHCDVTITGEANHAGATPMNDRTDALAAASEFVLDVERAANEVVASESESAVGTVGSHSVEPNATNVVPGRVDCGVDIRDVEYDSMNEIVSRARSSLARLESERGVETELTRAFDVEPVPMSGRCRSAVREAGEAAGIKTMAMHSGAAHDTMQVARVTDAGMLFAPSRGGISHNPREWTDWADCATATQVLTGAMARLAGTTLEG
ncbi:Zn-dependent hydrolase [Halalkalicoccus jeotgali]|uniref:Amidase, hydantoinase/carbamoylase family protein n=1 Tax=Halalkalicoccus jeotgali (strain DSM 18796 / CECT 7217 / JCM 14584 / KCTC 4019 / B3) TaxID=795797 RepID=D8J414_HALJB|nr:Zn-dependent hydrolase [Halalkalicoccus jeotgali]ADJ15406.1 amidase, hydantoinase/carbamoylase family protein [Halalkalicoccus jeotgali B3]ELY35818.1 amidase, hydantoinase/carbamoylase family protein [Halalkalicoccus jeotgali B3]